MTLLLTITFISICYSCYTFFSYSRVMIKNDLLCKLPPFALMFEYKLKNLIDKMYFFCVFYQIWSWEKNIVYCRQSNRRDRMEYEICGERLAQIREERKNSLPGECHTEWSWLQKIQLHTSSTINRRNLYDEV